MASSIDERYEDLLLQKYGKTEGLKFHEKYIAMYETGFKGPYSTDEEGIVDAVLIDDGNGGAIVRPATNFERETWEQMLEENSADLDELYSNNAGQTCEVCDEDSKLCVCEVVYKHSDKDGRIVETYYWKDRTEEKKAIPNIIFGMEKVNLNYKVTGLCNYTNKGNHCTDIYYYDRSLEREKDFLKKPLDRVKWHGKSNDDLVLKYSTDLAKRVHLDSSGSFVIIKKENDGDTSGLLLLSRSLSFLLWGELDELPLTAYWVGATACLQTKQPPLSIKTHEKLIKQTLKGTNTTVVVTPTYKAIGSIKIGFSNYQDPKTKIKEEEIRVTDSLSYIHETKTEEAGGYKFQILGELKDYINGNETKLEIDLLEVGKYAKHLPVPLNFIGKLAPYLETPIFEFLKKEGMGFTITPILPLITISGEANLESKDKGLFIAREDVLLKAAPLIGFTLEVDLIELFLLKPPIKAIAEKVGNSVKRLSKHAKVNAMTEAQAKAQIERSRNSFASVKGELLIYANFRFKLDLETQFSVASGNVNEDVSADKSANAEEDQSPSNPKKKAKGLNYIGASAAFEVEAGASFEMEVTAFFGAFKASAGAEAALNISGKGYVAYEKYITDDSDPEDIQTEWEGKVWHDGILMRYKLSATAKVDTSAINGKTDVNTNDPSQDNGYVNTKGEGGYSDTDIILVDALKKEEGWEI